MALNYKEVWIGNRVEDEAFWRECISLIEDGAIGNN